MMQQMLAETNGTPSSMRLMCLLALLAAMVFGVLTIVFGAQGKPVESGLYLTYGFLVAAFGGKVSQKPFEQLLPSVKGSAS